MSQTNTVRVPRDTYDEQIEALLHHDYDTLEDLTDILVSNHHEAWDMTGGSPGSLFEHLPSCACCASQIENSLYITNSEERRLRDLLLAEAPLNLPSSGPGPGNDFTREQLEEFARRQRLARRQ